MYSNGLYFYHERKHYDPYQSVPIRDHIVYNIGYQTTSLDVHADDNCCEIKEGRRCRTVKLTRNIFKKDIRRLSNTDDKRNQIRWFRGNSHLPLRILESKSSEVVVLFLSLFCLVLCTSNSFRWAICIWIFFFNFKHSPARVWEQCFKS